jgi:hypothetical protein
MMSSRTSYDKSEIFLYGLVIGRQLVAFSVSGSSTVAHDRQHADSGPHVSGRAITTEIRARLLRAACSSGTRKGAVRLLASTEVLKMSGQKMELMLLDLTRQQVPHHFACSLLLFSSEALTFRISNFKCAMGWASFELLVLQSGCRMRTSSS